VGTFVQIPGHRHKSFANRQLQARNLSTGNGTRAAYDTYRHSTTVQCLLQEGVQGTVSSRSWVGKEVRLLQHDSRPVVGLWRADQLWPPRFPDREVQTWGKLQEGRYLGIRLRVSDSGLEACSASTGVAAPVVHTTNCSSWPPASPLHRCRQRW